jgi:membrane protein
MPNDQETIESSRMSRSGQAAAWSKAMARRASERASHARQSHATVDAGFRSGERQRRVAAMVLAGGIAYRVFFWMLAISVLFSGVLGFFDPEEVRTTLVDHGAGAWIADAVAQLTNSADGDEWWLLPIGCWLVLWTGYTCSKAFVLAHATIWRLEAPRLDKPLRAALLFNVVALGFILAIAAARWVREQDDVAGLFTTMVVVGVFFLIWLFVSRRLPNNARMWFELAPGALLVAVGLQAVHLFTVYFLGPKLNGATELYGLVGVVTTLLFWLYLGGRLIIAGAALNAEFVEARRAGVHAPSGASRDNEPAEAD